ncbi:tripartite motif-containing protein 14 [Latimeria chalumnae]|uniref:tripartite motif-containing protein 14 n=1 Tax=Latimeria chalumnae TaxID=7897 RepID=UPI0003C14ED1|nr:PREDICTED: tripartite motif-containing protein 14 [Latimeria chalumnae]|eukprot:XP_006008114.1 PREDICTED: tripartite motif-containing protein 14 [Latimeria chalumnae]
MATSSPLAEPAEPTCGLCLGVSLVPLTLPCWHPFCLACIEAFWQWNPDVEHGCPLCLAPSPAILCDFCLGPSKQAAEKTCLTCLAAFCGVHLEPHLSGPAFRSHRLCQPRANLPALCCAEHHKLLEMYCKDCKLCVCSLCPVLGKHMGHRVSVVEQEAEEKKERLRVCLNWLKGKKKQEIDNIKHILQASADLKLNAEESKTWVAVRFTELRLLVDEEEKSAKLLIDERTKQALQTYNEQKESCEERAGVIDNFSERIKQILQQPDHVQLLKDFVAEEKEMQLHQSPAEALQPVPLTFEKVQKYIGHFMESVKSTLQTPLEKRLEEGILNSPSSLSNQTPGTIVKTKLSLDRPLFLRHARSPTFEPETHHSRLRLSEDRHTVSCAWVRTFFNNHPQRFDKLWQVLSKDSFFSGCHYWEVDLLNASQGWWIGVAYPSIKRKGDTEHSRLGWNRRSWCIKRFDMEYWAFHNGLRIPLLVEEDPEIIGVFLDYEAGTLSFYDVVCKRRHLYTFHAKFTEPLYPAFRLWEGSITLCKLT